MRIWVLLSLFIIGLGITTAYFKRDLIETRIQDWVETGLIQKEIDELNKKLPFQIEHFRVEGKLRHFLTGSELPIHIEIKKDSIRMIADGLARLDIRERNLSEVGIRFSGKTLIQNIPYILPHQLDTQATIEVTLKNQLKTLASLSIKTTPVNIEIKQPEGSVKITEAPIELSKIEDQFLFLTRAKSIEIQNNEEHLIQISHPEIQAKTDLKNLDLQFRAQSSEILWGKWYFDLKLKPFLMDVSLDILKQDLIKIGITEGKAHPLKVEVRDLKKPEISWDLRGLSIPFIWNQIKIHPSELSQGALDSQGHLSVNLEKKSISKLTSKSKIINLRYKWFAQNLAFKDLNADIDFELNSGHPSIPRGTLSVDKIFIGGFHGNLSPYSFHIDEKGFESIPTNTSIPIHLNEIPIQVGPMVGTWSDFEHYDLGLSLKMAATPLKNFYSFRCVQSNRPLPAQVEFDFPKIELSQGAVDLQGKVEAHLWGGTITLEELGFYDLLTEVPESDFDLYWSGIRLDLAGDFFNLGEIDGTLEGHADDVVVQGWLPTQFKFLSEMKPQHHKMVVLSPNAMKNVVRLIAAEGVDQIPGIAQWLAFGWPSRLLGGYDVNYAGIQATSQDGWIELKTLDPDKIFEIEQKHFILYGPRFKMPLNTVHYPLLIDASAMGNFMRRVTNELREMAHAKHPEENESYEENHDCFKPDF